MDLHHFLRSIPVSISTANAKIDDKFDLRLEDVKVAFMREIEECEGRMSLCLPDFMP